MSQPVVETCLSVPSWRWRAGGVDRSLARRAFAADLPPSIVRRHVKGGPDGFTARILDRFRAEIRERLLDGHLAREKIVDREAVAHELDHGPGGGEERARILELVAAEAWIDSWLTRRSMPCPP
jgi:asparagine synthase (glutamine-hydrolysing)